MKDKTVPVVPAGLGKRLAWMKPIARPLRGTHAFEAVRAMIARKPQHPPLTGELRQRLNDYYRSSIEELEQMSGQSLSHWYAPVVQAKQEIARSDAPRRINYQGQLGDV